VLPAAVERRSEQGRREAVRHVAAGVVACRRFPEVAAAEVGFESAARLHRAECPEGYQGAAVAGFPAAVCPGQPLPEAAEAEAQFESARRPAARWMAAAMALRPRAAAPMAQARHLAA
jgi:hypothetical protein